MADGCVNDASLDAVIAVPNVQQALLQNIAVTLNDVNSTQNKKKLKINLSNRNISQFVDIV